MSVMFRLVSFEIGLAVGFVVMVLCETVRFVVLNYGESISDSMSKSGADRKARKKAEAEAFAKRVSEMEAIAEKRASMEAMEQLVAKVRFEFESKAVACAALNGNLEFPLRDPDKMRSDIADLLKVAVTWMLAEARRAVTRKLDDPTFRAPEDISSFFAGAWLAMLCKYFSVPPGSKPVAERYGPKISNLLQNGAFAAWTAEAVMSTLNDGSVFDFLDVYPTSVVVRAMDFPRWATPDTGVGHPVEGVSFPFALAAFFILRGLYGNGDNLKTEERLALMNALSATAAPLRRPDNLKDEGKPIVEGWTFLHEFFHFLSPKVQQAFPGVGRTMSHLLWDYNARDGGRRLYRDYISPGLGESPMFIALAGGYNPVVPILDEREASGVGIDREKALTDLWDEIMIIHSFDEQNAWGCIEFIRANRYKLDASRGAEESAFVSPELKREIEELTVPVVPLTHQKYERKSDTIFQEQESNGSSEGDLGYGGHRIVSQEDAYARPLICDAARLNAWYLRAWMDWAVQEEHRPNPTGGMERNDFYTDVSVIMEMLIETSAGQVEAERALIKIVDKFADAQTDDGMLDKVDQLLSNAISEVSHRNAAYEKYENTIRMRLEEHHARYLR